MLRGIAVLDTGGAITRQARLLEKYPTTFIVFHPPARTYRYFLHHAELPRLARRLAPARGRVTFLGAGEYHHLTAALLQVAAAATGRIPFAGGALKIHGPFEEEEVRPAGMGLVVVDAHPEWSSAPAGYLHCGSWLPHVLSQPWLRAAALVGVGRLEAQGMLDPRVVFGVKEAVRAQRLRVYPARRSTALAISKAFRLPAPPLSLEEDVEGVVSEVLAFLGAGPTYLSIDKDVVASRELPSAWSGGEMGGDEVLRLVEGLLGGGLDLVGADVCGEWEPAFQLSDGRDPVFLRQEAFNLRLLERLLPGEARRIPGAGRLLAESAFSVDLVVRLPAPEGSRS